MKPRADAMDRQGRDAVQLAEDEFPLRALARELRDQFQNIMDEPVPDELAQLLHQLEMIQPKNKNPK